MLLICDICGYLSHFFTHIYMFIIIRSYSYLFVSIYIYIYLSLYIYLFYHTSILYFYLLLSLSLNIYIYIYIYPYLPSLFPLSLLPQLCDKCLLLPNEVTAFLYTLHASSLAECAELPQQLESNPRKTFYLWRANETNARTILLDKLCTAAEHLLLRYWKEETVAAALREQVLFSAPTHAGDDTAAQMLAGEHFLHLRHTSLRFEVDLLRIDRCFLILRDL